MKIYFRREDELSLLSVKLEAVRIHQRFLCKNPGCDNEARYTSNYCGVCDLLLNEGKGEKL